MLDSLAVAACPGLGFGAVRFGEAPRVLLGVIALIRRLSGGLDCSWFRAEYGPAVAGLGASSGLSGRFRTGLTGAPESPRDVGASGLVRVAATVAVVAVEAADTVEEFETVRAGEKCAIAEPGRAGRLFLVARALFCAIIASRRLGLEAPIVLLDSPRPGRGAPPAVRLGEDEGLFGSFRRSFWAVASRLSMIISALPGQTVAKVQ